MHGLLGGVQGLLGGPKGRLAAQVAAAGGEGFCQQGLEATGHLLVLGGLHGAAAAPLQLAHQGCQVVVGSALGEQVVAGAALHHPQMGPAAPQQAARLAATQGVPRPQELRQALLRLGPLPVGAATGAQQHLAGGPTEAFQHGPGLAAGGKGQLHLGLAQVQARLQGLHRRARGRGPQEQAAVQGLHQGAFARLVGTADQGQPRAELQGQVAMDADVLQAAGEQAHGGQGGPEGW